MRDQVGLLCCDNDSILRAGGGNWFVILRSAERGAWKSEEEWSFFSRSGINGNARTNIAVGVVKVGGQSGIFISLPHCCQFACVCACVCMCVCLLGAAPPASRRDSHTTPVNWIQSRTKIKALLRSHPHHLMSLESVWDVHAFIIERVCVCIYTYKRENLSRNSRKASYLEGLCTAVINASSNMASFCESNRLASTLGQLENSCIRIRCQSDLER